MGHYFSEIDPEGAERLFKKTSERHEYTKRGWTTVRTGEYAADELFACPECSAVVKWEDLDKHTEWHTKNGK